MAASVVEEQHPPPSTWSKTRSFLSFGNKRQSVQRRSSVANGVDTHERVDDDAQDGLEATSASQQPAAPAAAAASSSKAAPPLSSSSPPDASTSAEADGIARRRSQESVAPDAEDEIEVASDEDKDAAAPPVIEFLHKGAPYFWLHNHFAIPVYYDNVRYPSSEHLFQCLKFPHRPEIAKAIRKAESASDAVRMAKKNATDVRKGWRQEGLNIIAMREVLLLKFTQHSELKRRLLQTGDADLVLASPSDVFWGAGRSIGATKTGVGRNELGKALMRTRESLLTTAGLGWGSGAKTV